MLSLRPRRPVLRELPHHWFVLSRSRELGREPLRRSLLGRSLVLFRDGAGRPAALVDRCPHRNVPLSLGRVDQGRLRCRYHGWCFDASGECVEIPGLLGDPGAKSRRAAAHATREQDGFVWIYSSPGVEPSREPFRFPLLGADGYASVRQRLSAPAGLLATLENTLDVPHTAHLHGGLFRTAERRHEIEVVVRREADRVEAEYLGEPRPPGIVGRLLAPGGGRVEHVDRFFLPSIAQVEYRLGTGSHLIVTSAMTPVSDAETAIFAVVTFRTPIPSWLLRPFLTPIALFIFRQDAWILARQTASLREFGGGSFASTELDALGPAIARLLGRAERGGAPAEGEVQETRFRMRV